MGTKVEKTRIQVYADPQLKRRIELAAARFDVPVTDYCLDAIVHRLDEDELLNADRITIDVNPHLPAALVAELKALHEQILGERGGELIDIDDALEGMRDERDEDIFRLH